MPPWRARLDFSPSYRDTAECTAAERSRSGNVSEKVFTAREESTEQAQHDETRKVARSQTCIGALERAGAARRGGSQGGGRNTSSTSGAAGRSAAGSGSRSRARSRGASAG